MTGVQTCALPIYSLRAAFPDEAELGHLVAQVALINAFNLIAMPLEKRPPRR